MHSAYALVLLSSLGLAAAADLPAIPAQALGVKKEQLFTDDFNRADLGAWKQVVPTFTVEDNALKGTQTRVDAPAADGKPAVKGHQAVAGYDQPTKDSIISCRFRFAGATSVSVEFDDRKYEGAHYGHICKITITPTNVTVMDQKEGTMRNDIYAMKDPSQKAERAKLLVGRSATFPNTIDATAWHTLVLETVGDAMRATIDDKPVAYLKSPGIAHPTKSKIELGCGGKDGFFDDLTIWNAEPIQ
jgi:hypothetical protein